MDFSMVRGNFVFNSVVGILYLLETHSFRFTKDLGKIEKPMKLYDINATIRNNNSQECKSSSGLWGFHLINLNLKYESNFKHISSIHRG